MKARQVLTKGLGLLGALASKPSQLQVVARDVTKAREPMRTDGEHLQAAIDWLCRAQDASGSGGVSGGFHFVEGWLPPYPETTGYIITTFLDYAARTGDGRYLQRAVQMGDWEIAVQLPSGAVRGGMGVNDYPIVFNTGQVILGWNALFRVVKAERFLHAARRAADWLTHIQDADGKWTKHNLRGMPRVYDTRVAWSILELYGLTHERRYQEAGEKNIAWALSLAQPNGWFKHANIYRENRGEMEKPPLTHTIAYVLSGLVEALPYLQEDLRQRTLSVIRAASHNILEKFEARRTVYGATPLGLPATLDREWQSGDAFSCLTGNAQIALTWLQLHALDAEPRLVDAASTLLDEVKATQRLDSSNPGVRGGIAGSYPVWGDYIAFSYPNWAAKFFADALAQKLVAEHADPPDREGVELSNVVRYQLPTMDPSVTSDAVTGDFAGQVALVTGAARGIGREIALALARRAATVVVSYREATTDAAAALEEVRGLSPDSIGVQTDIRRADECERMMEAIGSQFGRLDVLVNNAGIVKDGFFHKIGRDDWRSVIETNVMGMFNVTHGAIPMMRSRRYGRIVSIASVIGFSGNLGQTNYAASKAAIVGMTKSLALENASIGITVNAVAPGFIETQMTRALPDGIKEQLVRRIPAGRFGTPSEIADAVLYLASGRSAYITGTVLHVNGGLYL